MSLTSKRLRPVLLACAISLGTLAMNATAQSTGNSPATVPMVAPDATLLSVSAQADCVPL